MPSLVLIVGPDKGDDSDDGDYHQHDAGEHSKYFKRNHSSTSYQAASMAVTHCARSDRNWSAAWLCNSRDLNAMADTGSFKTITRRINGGLNGLAERKEFYA